MRKCNAPLKLTLPQAPQAAVMAVSAEGDVNGESEDEGAKPQQQQQQHIAGFLLAIRSMRLGERATFHIPPELAYGDEGKGDEGKGPAVGPGENLEFDIELLGIDGAYHRG